MRVLLSRWVRHVQKQLEKGALGPHLTELLWRNRHLYNRNWAEKYLFTTDHPHRIQIVEAVAAFDPLESVLEVGCASGANLICLRSRFPHLRLLGIDINPQAIKLGKRHFSQQGDSNVTLMIKKADLLIGIPDESVDVVIADAVLMFIPPKNIKKVLSEMIRAARRGLVLNEYHLHKGWGQQSYFKGGRWIHDLFSLIKEVKPDAKIYIHASAFTGGEWDTFGRLLS